MPIDGQKDLIEYIYIYMFLILLLLCIFNELAFIIVDINYSFATQIKMLWLKIIEKYVSILNTFKFNDKNKMLSILSIK